MTKVRGKNYKRNGKEGFKAQFREALRYLKESKGYIYAISLVFLAGILAGFIFYGQFSFLEEILKELMLKIRGLGLWETIGFILQNNAQSAFLGLFLGILLGIFPVINTISNGIILGYVMKGVFISGGISEFWKILPHGVFELPAIIISLALGLKLGMFVFSKKRKEELLERLKNSFFIFIFIVLPLLIVAAIVEGILIFIYK